MDYEPMSSRWVDLGWGMLLAVCGLAGVGLLIELAVFVARG
jgi:hypothetical protein